MNGKQQRPLSDAVFCSLIWVYTVCSGLSVSILGAITVFWSQSRNHHQPNCIFFLFSHYFMQNWLYFLLFLFTADGYLAGLQFNGPANNISVMLSHLQERKEWAIWAKSPNPEIASSEAGTFLLKVKDGSAHHPNISAGGQTILPPSLTAVHCWFYFPGSASSNILIAKACWIKISAEIFLLILPRTQLKISAKF